MCLDFLTIDWELKGLGHNSNMVLVLPRPGVSILGRFLTYAAKTEIGHVL